jgi:cytochrome c-type biogenesis protein CcmH/NrfG
VKKLTHKPEFNVDKMVKASKAAGGLAKWCVAIRSYGEAILEVRPLMRQQEEMSLKAKKAQREVEMKELEVAVIKKKLAELQEDYKCTLDLIESLNNDKEKCERRLVNASKLLELLFSEGESWRQEILGLMQ